MPVVPITLLLFKLLLASSVNKLGQLRAQKRVLLIVTLRWKIMCLDRYSTNVGDFKVGMFLYLLEPANIP